MTELDRARALRERDLPIGREVVQSFYLMGLVTGMCGALVALGLLAARVLG
jgi:hypothetical protein